jgi:hypothetical protein
MAENGRAGTAERNHRRTRRQLMAGGAGALGAAAVASLTRAAPAAASNGNPIIMGQGNQSTSNTFINDSAGDNTFSALATSNGTALEGDAADGIGVAGFSSAGTGVSGVSGSSAAHASAVYGEISSVSPGAFSAAVRGQNDGTGGNGIGVYGSHAGPGWGVYGTSVSGIGVVGSSATGVSGMGTTGVHGTTSAKAGTGVLAENTAGGQALNVNGVAAFSRSGVATVPAGHSTVSKSLPLDSASFVLATIQGNVTGLTVQGVTIVTGSPGSFTIHLNKAAAGKTKVAWFVVN